MRIIRNIADRKSLELNESRHIANQTQKTDDTRSVEPEPSPSSDQEEEASEEAEKSKKKTRKTASKEV